MKEQTNECLDRQTAGLRDEGIDGRFKVRGGGVGEGGGRTGRIMHGGGIAELSIPTELHTIHSRLADTSLLRTPR